MKKLILILSMIICSLFSYAQSFNASPTTVTSGGTVTFTALGESAVAHISGLTQAQFNGNTNVAYTVVGSPTFWSAATHSPTTIQLKLTNNTTQPVIVNISFKGIVDNDMGNQNPDATIFCNQALTINPTAPTQVGNDLESANFTRNNCAGGTAGTSVTYTIAANTYYASTKADANQLALNALNSGGQAYANANGQCKIIYYNISQSGSYYSQNCASGTYAATPVIYQVAAAKYQSTVSQADADAKAAADIVSNGQAYANANSACIITPKPVITGTSSSGTTIFLNFTNTTPPISNGAIEVKAVDNLTGQVLSNTNGTGTSMQLTNWLTPGRTFNITVTAYDSNHNSSNMTSDPFTFTMPGSNTPVTTYYSSAVSGTFAKNSCGTGFAGSSVTYTVPAGNYTSTVSQNDADLKAQNDVNVNGQTYANNVGSCTAISGKPTLTASYIGRSGYIQVNVTPNIANCTTSVIYWNDLTSGQSGSSAGAPSGQTLSGFISGHTIRLTVTCYGSTSASSDPVDYSVI